MRMRQPLLCGKYCNGTEVRSESAGTTGTEPLWGGFLFAGCFWGLIVAGAILAS